MCHAFNLFFEWDRVTGDLSGSAGGWQLRFRWKDGDGTDKMRGSLHCAVHDEAVNRFGRDDVVGWER